MGFARYVQELGAWESGGGGYFIYELEMIVMVHAAIKMVILI